MHKAWAVFSFVLFTSGCSLFGHRLLKPELEVIDITMQGGNFFQQSLLVRLKIRNPNDRALPVKGISANLRVEGEDIASGASNSPFTVPARGEAEFEMTVNANAALGLLTWASKRDRSNDSIAYELTGKVNIDLPLLHSIPFQETGAFSLQGKNAK